MTTLLTPAVVVHMSAAFAALAVGTVVALRRKGGPTHRLMGHAWMALMVTVALSSFFIRSEGHFSCLRLLSLATLALVMRAIQAARARRITAHRITVTSLYVGGLVIAGVFTLLPQRLLGRTLWSMLGMI
jgi:uncharacterized membrane protein